MISHRVLLVSPPWRAPRSASLALATLAPILEAEGFDVETLHGSLLYPRTSADAAFMNSYAVHFFAAWLEPRPSVEQVADAVVARFLRDANLEGLVVPGATRLGQVGHDEARVREIVDAEVVHAGICLDRCVERILATDAAVVGMSATFEGQLPAAVELARRLRQARPDVRIALGGAACFEQLGGALARAFPEIDAVCHCEGDGVVGPLMRALADGAPLSTVPGIAFVDGPRGLVQTPSPPLLRDLDALPVPDYDPFVAAHAASEWASQVPVLFFETARGCWWGEKTLCSFCGLNAEGLPFRAKSADRAVEEIASLHARYPTAHRLHATDNILAQPYLTGVLPRLRPLAATPERPLRLFWEIKPNLTRKQVRALADAGIDAIQPGIESFSDGVLALMRKGSTALGQLQLIKWASEEAIQLVYNLLVRNPGETVAHYEAQLALVDRIDHLPPPANVTTTWLERFSPYFTRPGDYGIANIRPRPHYAALYGEPAGGTPLADLAYVFDYDHAELHGDAALLAAQHRFVRRVGLWQYHWRPGALSYRLDGEALVVTDTRPDRARVDALVKTRRAVFEAFDRARPVEAVQRELAPVDVAQHLEDLIARGWACTDERGRALVVVPRESGRDRVS